MDGSTGLTAAKQQYGYPLSERTVEWTAGLRESMHGILSSRLFFFSPRFFI